MASKSLLLLWSRLKSRIWSRVQLANRSWNRFFQSVRPPKWAVVSGAITVGCTLTLLLSWAVETRQKKWLHSDFNSRAAAILTNFDLTLINQAIRLRVFESSLWQTPPPQFVLNQDYVDEILKYSLFDSLSLVKFDKFDITGLPKIKALNADSKRHEYAVSGAKFSNAFEVRKAIQTLIANRTPQISFIFEADGKTMMVMCVRSVRYPDYFFLFSGLAERFAPNLSMVSDKALMILTEGLDGDVWSFGSDSNGQPWVKKVGNDFTFANFEYIYNDQVRPTDRLMPEYKAFQSALVMSESGVMALTPFLLVLIPGFVLTLLGAAVLNALMNQRDQMERQVQEKTKALLIETNRAKASALIKTQFLANVSHEIRTPLNMILGMADLAAELSSSELQKDYLYNLKNAGRHLLVLIDDILEMSRIECHEICFEMAEIELVPLIEKLLMLTWPSVQKKGLQFKVDIDLELPARVRTDPSRISQIVINLLNNAIKYTPSGFVSLSVKRLCVAEADPQTEYIEFKVADSGVGIAKEKQSDVFRPFFQIGRSNVTSSGVGLGLAIINGIVKKMNGSIVLSSEKDKGTEFKVRIPVEVIDKKPWRDDLVLPPAPRHRKIGLAIRSKEQASMIGAMAQAVGAEIVMFNDEELLEELNVTGSRQGKLAALVIDQGAYSRNFRTLFHHSDQILILCNRPLVSLLSHPNVQYLTSPILPSRFFEALRWKGEVRSVVEYISDSSSGESREARISALANQRLSLVVADDDLSNHTLMSAYFAGTQWKVRFVNDGQEALDACHAENPDIVIADLQMPKVDGFELFKLLREKSKAENRRMPKFIMLTADAMAEALQEAKRLNVDLFLTKPVSKFDVMDAIAAVQFEPSDTPTMVHATERLPGMT